MVARTSEKKIGAVIFAVSFALLFVSPCYFGEKAILPWKLDYLENGYLIAQILTGISVAVSLAVLYYVRKEKHLAAFLIVFSLLFYTHSPLLIFVCFVLLILRTAADSCHLFLHCRLSKITGRMKRKLSIP